jgi:flagellar biosynthesis/type III secretory pathway protein FliH
VVSYVIQQDSVIPEPDLLAALYEAEPHLEEVMASCADQWEARGLERGIVIGMERGHEQGLERGLERGLEQGLERGLEQGLERGHREATSASLVRLGTRLLGAPPAEVQRRLQAADVAALEQALDAVLDATSWEQLFAR